MLETWSSLLFWWAYSIHFLGSKSCFFLENNIFLDLPIFKRPLWKFFWVQFPFISSLAVLDKIFNEAFMIKFWLIEAFSGQRTIYSSFFLDVESILWKRDSKYIIMRNTDQIFSSYPSQWFLFFLEEDSSQFFLQESPLQLFYWEISLVELLSWFMKILFSPAALWIWFKISGVLCYKTVVYCVDFLRKGEALRILLKKNLW